MHLRIGRYKTVEEVVTLTDLQAGGIEIERPKDLSDLLTAGEIRVFNQMYDSSTDKVTVVKAKVSELVARKLARDEGFTMERAEDWVQIGFDRLFYSPPEKFPLSSDSKPSPIAVVLETAEQFHFALYRIIFTNAMQLNQWDFERLFAERSCVHDSDLVYQLAKDPSFRPTDEQRKQHFVTNREMSFGILMSFAGFMVYEQTTNPDMRVISMATAYNVLKGVFNPEPSAQSHAEAKPHGRVK